MDRRYLIGLLSLLLVACGGSGHEAGSIQVTSDKFDISYDGGEYSAEDKALMNRVMNDLANKVCPSLFSRPESIEDIKVGVNKKWFQSVEVVVAVKQDRAFGQTYGNCFFHVGRNGVYIKKSCCA